MNGLRTFGKGTGRAMLVILVVAIAGARVPAVEVHAHDDAAFGHSHDNHGHVHETRVAQHIDAGDDSESTAAVSLHAHADGCVSVGLTSSVDAEISIPAWGESYYPRTASRPPDKPVPPLYRPPIA